MLKQEERFDILQGRYALKEKEPRQFKFKAEYSTLFPTKMSSSNFIQLYTLYLLNNKEKMYGAQILRSLKSAVDKDVWKPSHGTLYPLLQILEDDGFIEVCEVVRVNPDSLTDKRIKKYYSITEEGREELDKRLEEFKSKLIGSSMFFKNVVDKFYNNF